MKSAQAMAREAARKIRADAARAEGSDAVLMEMVADSLMGPAPEHLCICEQPDDPWCPVHGGDDE